MKIINFEKIQRDINMANPYNCYIIVYDLKHVQVDYTPLYEVIKSTYPRNFHLTENSWIIFPDNGDEAADISANICHKLVYDNYNSDCYCIFKLDDLKKSKDYAGFVGKPFWEFLEGNKETKE